MSSAVRLATETSHWIPDARHYQVDGGYLVVVMCNFLTAEGTDVFYTDEDAQAHSMEPIATYPHGTTHNQALEALGYIVVDTIIDTPTVQREPEPEPQPVSVFDLLPPEIAARIEGAS
jgi:hypothetical protein